MKMKYIDIALTAVFTVVVLILLFLHGCSIDIIIALVSAAVLIVSVVVSLVQYRKIKELQKTEVELQK